MQSVHVSLPALLSREGHMSVAEVPAAVLPGTPTPFPISPAELIEKAKQLHKDGSGVKQPDLLADSFRFEFPVVSLSKKDYIKAVSSFNLDTAFPNMNSHAYDFRVDKYEPNRVWFTIRNTGTHMGPLKFLGRTIKPTGKVVLGAPECLSYTFDAEGKVTSFTGGYIMDRRVGNTQKLGALFGILAAIGHPLPSPGSLKYLVATTLQWLYGLVRGALTLVFGKKDASGQQLPPHLATQRLAQA
ncbi:hypothetical protein WJX81_000318 [Elliptochloris bilobata]|uniref:Uncharacterized protein n=1 Tax=Elliptochloris bilobata TaxID=381761 RepID=A0AAW1RG99_9CHLO